ncbi:hypothetical protein CEXT_212071 [Caerostris extrusa]|uniref:Uncharacterized protein n=1 Tax=Caerostris extrusa TaxID=172846 RepID=A0AAV4S6D2_CAEEX|nr:hypothetical protein CEXT_212071 [Caerostris extrusa]
MHHQILRHHICSVPKKLKVTTPILNGLNSYHLLSRYLNGFNHHYNFKRFSLRLRFMSIRFINEQIICCYSINAFTDKEICSPKTSLNVFQILCILIVRSIVKSKNLGSFAPHFDQGKRRCLRNTAQQCFCVPLVADDRKNVI